MRKSALVFLLAAFGALAADARTATIDWIPIGNPGNANDPADGDSSTSGIQNFGAVAYAYRIDKYDVTNSQYSEFLNSNDPTGANALGLYSSAGMADVTYGGISYNSGAAYGSKYSVISGDGEHPVNFVSWYDAIRFANWLNNGQVAGSTETGAYTLGALDVSGQPIHGESIVRNAGATVFLSSENEWYKAAYYDPASSSYFKYPTSSNTPPTENTPTSTPNSANFSEAVGSPTDVGAYSGTTSPYGAFDMAGNIEQWNEALVDLSLRGLRGGSYGGGSELLLSSFRNSVDPERGFNGFGFRVAMVPEPSTVALAAFGFVGLADLGLRRWKRARLIASS